MSLIQQKAIEGFFQPCRSRRSSSSPNRSSIEGESVRQRTRCALEEVASGEWTVSGQALTAADVQGPGPLETAGRQAQDDQRTASFGGAAC